LIATCPKCTHLYEAASEEQANDPVRLCRRCAALAELLGVVDEFVMWRRATEVIAGSAGADRLSALLDKLIERADRVSGELRAP
jgi:hypothetical protein